MKRRRERKREAEEQAALAAAAAKSESTPTARRVVAAPATTSSATSPPTMPDRVDALTEAIGGELGRLRGEMRGRDADLVQALQQVAASYDRVAARLDDERRVQALLAEALVRIDRRLAAMEGKETKEIEATPSPSPDELPRPQRVIGGSIAPRQDIPRIDH